MVNLDEIAKLLGKSVAGIEENTSKAKKQKKVKETVISEVKQVPVSEEAIEEKIEEPVSEIEHKVEAVKTEEEKEQEEIDKEYVDPLSEEYKRQKNNLIGRKVFN